MSDLSIGRFVAALDRIVDPALAADWDVSGLQLGDPDKPARRVGVCHEVTEEVVAAVERDSIDLLVTYHPLIFRPTTRVVAGRWPAGRAFRLITAGVGLVVAHTSFDACDGGMADAMVDALGLTGMVSFGPVTGAGTARIGVVTPVGAVTVVAEAMKGAGATVVANNPVADGTELIALCSEPSVPGVIQAMLGAHPTANAAYDVVAGTGRRGFIGRVGAHSGTWEALVDRCVDVFGSGGLRVSPGDGSCRKVAVVPGSGGSFVAAAAGAGADVLITGDVGHHSVVEAADRGIAVIDPGHGPTERPGIRRLVTVVRTLGAEVVDLTDVDPTPWR
jgi:dinuclear metal center YbgI/SA1388 family protein